MAKKSTTKGKTSKRPRPKLPPISEEMKVWSALLGQELNGWPHVTSRPMFGLLGFYRRKKIFAALPVTRGVNTPSSLMFRIQPIPVDLLARAQKEPRIDTERHLPGAKWFSFEIQSTADVRAALWWLNQAYERAA
jgi:hypothetical protein